MKLVDRWKGDEKHLRKGAIPINPRIMIVTIINACIAYFEVISYLKKGLLNQSVKFEIKQL